MGTTVAVIGNPNVGKTTLFNALTGLSQVTGNYPGVTVERKVGKLRLNGATADLIDLPGTYSLAARSPDEMIVVDVLLGQQQGENPIDAVLAVVDATNLERNLYLVSQLRELGKPLVVALNMCDLAERRHIRLDEAQLARELGVPVVCVCAHKRIGIEKLRQALAAATHEQRPPNGVGPEFPEALVAEVDALKHALNDRKAELGRAVHRFEAFRLLIDRGGYVEQRLRDVAPAVGELVEEHRRNIASSGSLAALETRSRYRWIQHVVSAGVRRPPVRITTFSDKLDAVLTHKIYGAVIFALIMAVVFQAIYAWAEPLMQLTEAACAAVGGAAGAMLPEGVLRSLVVDGIVAGVGGVLVFLPQILILMLFIALLEDCGYMARAAFLMDKLLSRCGLSGQSFIPMLSSFACAIPGIMATRTIGNKRDRFTTILVAPLMSCSARLPVYTIMIAAFIPDRGLWRPEGVLNLQGLTLFAMYSLGIVVAVPVAWLLKRTLLRGETPAFLLELPSYKWPQFRTVCQKVYRQGKEFVTRAGTVILAISIIVWALAYFPRSAELSAKFDAERARLEASGLLADDRAAKLQEIDARESGAHLRNSYFGRMGLAIEPLVRPLGWDWRIGMATIASFPAREVVVATLGTIFYLGSEVDETSESLKSVLREAERPEGGRLFNIPVALSIMVFFALCCQCGATLAIIRRETRSIRWPVFTFAYMTTLAYAAALITYQTTMWLGWGGA